MMVFHLLATDSLDRALENLILEKSEGIPFFIEEFIRSLNDLKLIEIKNGKFCLTKDFQNITIPSTIQDVIMARVDILPEAVKRVLQTGSVIEREFSYELINKVTGLPEQELLTHLSALKDLELIYERGIFPQTAFIFKHALTREVVYDSILTKRRKKLHGDIGNAIESHYQARLEEFYEILAYHFSMTENAEKAIEYWHMAGRRALKLYAVDETTEYFTRALQKIEALPPGDNRNDLKLEVGTKLGFSYLLRNIYSKAIEIVQPLEVLATEKRHLRSLGRIYTTTGMASMNIELDIEKGIEYLKRSVKLSKQTKDLPALSFGRAYLAEAHIELGNMNAAKREYAELISILEEKHNWYTLAAAYCGLSFIFCVEANAESAEKWSRKSYECIEKLDDPFTKSWGNLAVGNLYLGKGKLDEAETRLSTALDCAKQITLHRAIEGGLIYLIELCLRKGEYDTGLKYIHELGDLLEHEKVLILSCRCRALEAEVYLHSSKFGKAFECLEVGKKFKVPYQEGYLYRIFGDYFRELGPNNYQSSQEWIEKAIQVHERIGMRLELGKDFFSYGKMLKLEGRQGEAKRHFDKALGIFCPFGAEWDIHQVEEAIKGLQTI